MVFVFCLSSFQAARMPVERTATEYNMNHKKRGKALIFNHQIYEIPSLSERIGTHKDCRDVGDAFRNLGFDVNVHQDCKHQELMKAIQNGNTVFLKLKYRMFRKSSYCQKSILIVHPYFGICSYLYCGCV